MKLNLLAIFAITASAAFGDTIYALDVTQQSLVTINPVTGAITQVGKLGISDQYGDLAYDPVHNVLYMSTGVMTGVAGTDFNLYTIDMSTGAATLLGRGNLNTLGLAFDTDNGLLYGDSEGALIYYNPASVDTLQGLVGNSTDFEGLTYRSDTHTLYGLVPNGDFYSVNTVTSATTLLASTGLFVNTAGFTWDPDRQVWWAVGNDQLYQYSADFSTHTDVESTGDYLKGIAFVNTPEPGSSWLILPALGALQWYRRKRNGRTSTSISR